MRIVRGDKANIQLFCELVQPVVDLFLHLDAMILHLEIEMVAVENLQKLFAQLVRTVHIPFRQRARNHARKAGRQADQALAVLPQQIHIDARLHIEALSKAERHHMDQVAVAGHILAQQNQVAVPLPIQVAAVKARVRRKVHLAPDDRMNALGLAGAVKVDHAVHDAVVGQRTGGLAERGHAVHKTLDAARAVQQAVFTMHMQMRKWYHFNPP